MTLIQDAATRLGLDPDAAATALGVLLFGARLGLDPQTWQQVRDAVPDVPAVLARAPAGGRTAEMISLTAPGSARKSLEATGLPRATINGLADALRAALRNHLPADVADRAVTALDRAIE